MKEKNFVCKQCSASKIKVGKISGIAGVRAVNARTGLGGSDLKIYFCESCGAVVEMYVENPEAVKE